MSPSVALLALAAACAKTPEGTLTLVTGEAADVFSRAPAPVTLVTEKIAYDGTKTEIARTQLPTDSVDLGERGRSEVSAIAVTGLDATGKAVIHGETLFVQWGALEGVNLQVFMQRTGELARLPQGPAAFDATQAVIYAGRFVFGVNGTSSLLYDLLALSTPASITLPRNARSVLSVDTTALLIDETGATTVDLSSGATGSLDAPTGGTYAEVAGGSLVFAPDGTQYLVGATRPVGSGGATARVLVVSSDGQTSFAALATPREGACATFVAGRGLVVYGGDAHAAGAELLATGAQLAAPLPFPTDDVKGCAATALDSAHLAVVGGGAGGPVRVFDLACTTACVPVAWADPLPLVRAEAVTLAPDTALVLGDDATGASHLYRATATAGLREIPLRTPRRGARLLPTPTNAFAVVGGGEGIEQYRD